MIDILAAAEYPSWLQHPAVHGVCVRACIVDQTRSCFYQKAGAPRMFAHAHIGGSRRGWICVRSRRLLQHRLLMLHELAHVIVCEGHTDMWASTLLKLGGTLDPFSVDGHQVLSYRAG